MFPRSAKVRHLVTTIHDASHFMKKVGCSAENDETEDYRELQLNISYRPLITSINQTEFNLESNDGEPQDPSM